MPASVMPQTPWVVFINRNGYNARIVSDTGIAAPAVGTLSQAKDHIQRCNGTYVGCCITCADSSIIWTYNLQTRIIDPASAWPIYIRNNL